MTEPLAIRGATLEDLPDIVGIYNHYVENGHATFDTRPFEVDERRGWFEQFADTGPYRLLVATLGDRVLGFASSTPLKPKPAYAVSVETSVYLDPTATGAGWGRRLMERLLEELEGEELHGAYAQIALPGDASEVLHQRLGYRRVGTLTEVGRKFGRYWDVAWYELRLGGASPDPESQARNPAGK